MPRPLRMPAIGFAVALGLVAPAVQAARPCSFDKGYPEVAALDIVDGRLIATLGGHFAPDVTGVPAIRIALADDGGWQRLPDTTDTTDRDDDRDDTTQCPAAPVDEEWLRSERKNPSRQIGFHQQVTACTASGSTEWGAVAFSRRDGAYGSALFEHEDGTESFDYWPPVLLARYSVRQMIFADEALWLGTAQEGECVGPSPGFGIYRVDVLDDSRRDYTYPETGVCGFAARDMAVHDGRLWIATELGLARLDEFAGGPSVWQNFLPDPGSPELMRPMTCDALYEAVLNMPHMFTDEAFDLGYAFDDFWKRLSALRPQFVARYLRRLLGR